MFGKSFIVLGALGTIGAWLAGAFGAGSYERVVDASPAAVQAALMDLDVREAPGAPGSDPSRSGGVEPMFQVSQQGNDVVWTVTSGDKIAIELTAHLEPRDGGKRTRVTASYKRGSAPDDLVSPAFRSAGVTMGLFAIVLEGELDELVAPARADPATCQKILDDFTASGEMSKPGFAGVAKSSLRLSALEGKLKAAGCPTGFNDDAQDEFAGPSISEMGEAASAQPADEVNFEMGKPMISKPTERESN